MSCSLCIEDFNGRRKKVVCKFCEYETCSMCTKKYLLSRRESVHCMNCNKLWSQFFIVQNLGSTFVMKEYKDARKNILYDLEKAMFFDTQPFVEREKVILSLEQRKRTNLANLHQLQRRLYNMRQLTSPELIEQWGQLCNEIYVLTTANKVADMLIEYENGKNPTHTNEDRRKFVKQCPRTNCNGFLSTQWKCGVCEKYSCHRCHEPKDDDHICDETLVQNISLIKSDSKTCPKCGVSIHKTEGCDQMYCTHCHVAFSWRTGKIETGRIHNPYYYMYMRERGVLERELGDIQCGGVPSVNTIISNSRKIHKNMDMTQFYKFHRIVIEFENVEFPRYRPYEGTEFDKNLRDRIKHILGYMSEKEFKTSIMKKDIHISKCIELTMISATFIQIFSDLCRRMLAGEDITEEVKEACNYINELYRNTSKSYSCRVPNFAYPNGYAKTKF